MHNHRDENGQAAIGTAVSMRLRKDGPAAWSASDVPSTWGFVPISMTGDQIEEDSGRVRRNAVRASEAARRGVELHLATVSGAPVYSRYDPAAKTNTGYHRQPHALRQRNHRRRAQGSRTRIIPWDRVSDQHVDGRADAQRMRRDRCVGFLRAKEIDFVKPPWEVITTLAMLPTWRRTSARCARAADRSRARCAHDCGTLQQLESGNQAFREGVADMGVGIVRALIADAAW